MGTGYSRKLCRELPVPRRNVASEKRSLDSYRKSRATLGESVLLEDEVVTTGALEGMRREDPMSVLNRERRVGEKEIEERATRETWARSTV